MNFKHIILVLFVLRVVGGLYFFIADNFIIDSPFSEDNFKFKENNNEKTFIANDNGGIC